MYLITLWLDSYRRLEIFVLVVIYLFSSNISNTSDSVSSGYPSTEKTVENTTRSGVFLTEYEVFG